VKLLLIALVLSSTVFAGEKDFDQIVKAIETHYGAARTHIPLLGVANLFVKARHLEGVSGFKIAVFEDLKGAAGDSSFMDNFSSNSLTRIVRVSGHEGEAAYIFSGEAAKSARLLVATFDPGEATVVEVKVDAAALIKLLADPRHMGSALTGPREE
jgi:hypothetical protein